MMKVTHLLIKRGRGPRILRKLIKVQSTTKTINEAAKNPLKRVKMTEKKGTNFTHLKDMDIAKFILT